MFDAGEQGANASRPVTGVQAAITDPDPHAHRCGLDIAIGLSYEVCYRAELRQSQNRVANRIQKLLEQANVKLSSVASDTLGVSGHHMLEAIIAGQNDPQQLAQLARGQLRKKIPQLQQAREGRVREHHRFLLAEFLDDRD
jgi:hypothetical protein